MPYRPELRALLISGRSHWFLRRPADQSAPTDISQSPLWTPPTKIAGKRLGPYLDGLDAALPHANRFEQRITGARS